MSNALRPTEFVWNGAVGLARHEHVEMDFKSWPAALLPGRSISYLLYIPVTHQFELIENGRRRDLARDEKAAVYSWLKAMAAAAHDFFDRPAP
jgi:hypothetical protein